MFALLVSALSLVGVCVVGLEAGFDSTWFVVTVVLIGLGGSPFVGEPAQRLIPTGWWTRLSISQQASRRLGISTYDRALTAIGWNRLLLAGRPRNPDGSLLPVTDMPLKSSAAAHAWGFVIHLIGCGLAVFADGIIAAGWIGTLGIALHLHPTLLQLRNLTRLRPLRERRAARQGQGT